MVGCAGRGPNFWVKVCIPVPPQSPSGQAALPIVQALTLGCLCPEDKWVHFEQGASLGVGPAGRGVETHLSTHRPQVLDPCRGREGSGQRASYESAESCLGGHWGLQSTLSQAAHFTVVKAEARSERKCASSPHSCLLLGKPPCWFTATCGSSAHFTAFLPGSWGPHCGSGQTALCNASIPYGSCTGCSTSHPHPCSCVWEISQG